MKGKKQYQEKLLTVFRLSGHVPEENFYRCLKDGLDLDFLRPLTKDCHWESGQESMSVTTTESLVRKVGT